VLAFGGNRDPPPLRTGAPSIAPLVVGGLDVIHRLPGPDWCTGLGRGVGLVDQVGPGVGLRIPLPATTPHTSQCAAGVIGRTATTGGGPLRWREFAACLAPLPPIREADLSLSRVRFLRLHPLEHLRETIQPWLFRSSPVGRPHRALLPWQSPSSWFLIFCCYSPGRCRRPWALAACSCSAVGPQLPSSALTRRSKPFSANTFANSTPIPLKAPVTTVCGLVPVHDSRHTHRARRLTIPAEYPWRGPSRGYGLATGAGRWPATAWQSNS
jgi:hypothetical protein